MEPRAFGATLTAKLKLLGFVVALVGVECLLAYFCLPNPASAGASGQQRGQPGQETAANPPPKEQETYEDRVEVDLGQFGVTAYQPVSEKTLRIDFHLWGTVKADDEKAFVAAWGDNENRCRDQVIVIVRSAEINDLTDAGLGLIKRKILEKTNRTLGKPYLQAIIFSDFSFIEQ